MRVYNYLELANLEKTNLKLWIKVIKFLKNLWFELWGWIEDKHALEDFYSQPFKPEMITEYFEGWLQQEKLNDTTWFCGKGAGRFDNIAIHDNSTIRYELTHLDLAYIFIFPETLNDFIRDCERAGIELQWKVKV